MRAEWRAMNTDRNLIGIIAVFVAKIETAWLRKIDLIRRDGKLAADHTPGLNVYLWSIKRRFVRHFDIINSRILEYVPCHLLRLFPKLRFIDKFLPELRGVMRRETHQVLLDPEKLEVIQIHLVHGVELVLELLRCHVEVCVIHVQ